MYRVSVFRKFFWKELGRAGRIERARRAEKAERAERAERAGRNGGAEIINKFFFGL